MISRDSDQGRVLSVLHDLYVESNFDEVRALAQHHQDRVCNETGLSWNRVCMVLEMLERNRLVEGPPKTSDSGAHIGQAFITPVGMSMVDRWPKSSPELRLLRRLRIHARSTEPGMASAIPIQMSTLTASTDLEEGQIRELLAELANRELIEDGLPISSDTSRVGAGLTTEGYERLEQLEREPGIVHVSIDQISPPVVDALEGIVHRVAQVLERQAIPQEDLNRLVTALEALDRALKGDKVGKLSDVFGIISGSASLTQLAAEVLPEIGGFFR